MNATHRFEVNGGLTTRRELMAGGVSRTTIDSRCRPSGKWQRVLPGIVATFTGNLSPHQRRRAAVMWGGPGTALGAATAAQLHGLRYLPEGFAARVQLLVPYSSGRASTGFVVVRRTHTMPTAWMRDGLPVVPPARAVVDACREMRSLRDVRALVAEAVQRGITTVSRLEEEVDRGGSAGRQLVRRALDEVRVGVRSSPEAESRALVLAAGLPEPLWNHDLYTLDGEWIGRPDGWWAAGVAFEADSREYHLGPEGWEATMLRHERMSAFGIIVVHASPRRIHHNGDELAGNLWAALTAASGRPPPAVIAVPAGTPFYRPRDRPPSPRPDVA